MKWMHFNVKRDIKVINATSQIHTSMLKFLIIIAGNLNYIISMGVGENHRDNCKLNQYLSSICKRS